MNQEHQIRVNEANELRDAGKTEEAKDILQKEILYHDGEVDVNTLISMGICLSNEGDYDMAISHFKRAIKLAEGEEDFSKVGNITRDMAIAYMGKGTISTAINHFLESYKNLLVHGNNDSIGITASKLGLAYKKAGNYKEAKKCFQDANERLARGHHHYWMLISGIDECSLLIAMRQFKKAREKLDRLIFQAILQGKEYKLVEALIMRGDTEMARSRMQMS
uniref:Tetratricopeptide repeat protein n=1 Tax=candidate division CPR3 bacterium TaxID=2268181 RepID=A0A7C4R582_UNCC3